MRIHRRRTQRAGRSRRYFFFLPNTEPMPDLDFSPRWRTFNWPRMAVPADVDPVPLAFQVAQRAFIHLTQVAQRRGLGDQGVDLLPGRGGDFDGRQDQLQFLDQDALGFQELVVVLRAEFLGAGQVDEVVELFPALDVVLHLVNELVQFLIAHRLVRLALFHGRGGRFGGEIHDGAAPQFAGGDLQARVVDDQLGQGQLSRGGLGKGSAHLLGDVLDQARRESSKATCPSARGRRGPR